MIREIALDTVEFLCPWAHPRWVGEYHVVHYEDAEGGEYEFFSVQGVPVPSPYTLDGAPACPHCGVLVPGRLIARRYLEMPSEDRRPDRNRTGDGRGGRSTPVPVDRLGTSEPPPYWPGPPN
ncbi:hypothetical protein ACVGVM_07905 [Pseudonocardia bannensis]|uniref:Uncharacterized protein n=1 Tax=Pseudonocardia bannensis TaxID=630973 RepID=A0A848DCZ8_9PSEU|nr:hypothetical protein [Pseudonocardia bannensis]NMH90442.1 hypothetical protein [Pseudonocardia bannensis]